MTLQMQLGCMMHLIDRDKLVLFIVALIAGNKNSFARILYPSRSRSYGYSTLKDGPPQKLCKTPR